MPILAERQTAHAQVHDLLEYLYRPAPKSGCTERNCFPYMRDLRVIQVDFRMRGVAS